MLSQNGDAVRESGRVNFVNHKLRHQNRQKSIQLRILARQKPGAKWRQKLGQQGAFTGAILRFRRAIEQFRDLPEQLKTQRSSSSGAQHLDVQGSIMRAVLLDRASISGENANHSMVPVSLLA